MAAHMTISVPGLVYAAVFLALGLLELVVFSRAIYPALSKRHENLKVTQSHGRSPALISNIVRFQSLVLMPVIGYVVGSQIMTSGAP
jgi:hypothetical protein